MTLRDQYLVGSTGTHHVPSVARVDAVIRRLTARIADASPEERVALWADIDTLLDRRSAMTAGKVAAR